MKRLLRIAGLTLIFLLILAAVWQFARPMDLINRVSLYNHLFPGRVRLPFGESPQIAYNFSIGSLDAAFASHKIHGTGKKDPQTLRVVTVGDSSSWGTLLRPEETLCGARAEGHRGAAKGGLGPSSAGGRAGSGSRS